MVYILAALLPPIGLLVNGQPISAVLNLVIIVPCVLFGLIFPVLFLLPSNSCRGGGPYEAGRPQAPRNRRGNPAARPPGLTVSTSCRFGAIELAPAPQCHFRRRFNLPR